MPRSFRFYWAASSSAKPQMADLSLRVLPWRQTKAQSKAIWAQKTGSSLIGRCP